MRYEFIKSHASQFVVDLMCNILKVSLSVYYDWLTYKPGKRALANLRSDKIKTILAEHKQSYGHPESQKYCKHSMNLAATRVIKLAPRVGLEPTTK